MRPIRLLVAAVGVTFGVMNIGASLPPVGLVGAVLGAQPQTATLPPTVPAFRSMAGVDPKALQLWRLVPSADFGTAEATGRIAASAGFIDAVGVKPGMGVEAALAALKTLNPKFGITINRLTGYPGTPANAGPVTQISATSPDQFETVSVRFTWPPSPTVVFAVLRQISYHPGQEPTMANALAGLQKKYGPENGGMALAGQYWWSFDAKNQPAKLPASCGTPDANVGGETFQNFEEAVAKITLPGTGNGVPANWLRNGPSGCIDYTVVEAKLAPGAAGLTSLISVNLRSKILEQSAWVAFVKVAESFAADRIKKTNETGARQGSPVF